MTMYNFPFIFSLLPTPFPCCLHLFKLLNVMERNPNQTSRNKKWNLRKKCRKGRTAVVIGDSNSVLRSPLFSSPNSMTPCDGFVLSAWLLNTASLF